MQPKRRPCEDGRLRAEPSTTGAGWLLEREQALGRLGDLLAGAREGHSALAVVRGAAGVGKSTLLRVAEREARERGFQVLSARGDDLERGFPFGVAIQLFAEAVRGQAERHPELLAGAAALARPLLERAAPVLAANDTDPAFPLLHGLHWLAVNLSEQAPLLLSVDDVHWADAPTLRFLLYLAQRAEGIPLAILLARRTGELLAPESAELGERLEASAEPVELAALGRDSVYELVRRRIPQADAGFAEACFEASGGNPFLLGELLQEAVREGVADAARVRALHPASIRRAILGRLARLGEAARELARAAALLGPAPLDHAAALAGLEADAAAQAADLLAEAGILEPGARLGFVHPLLRDAVYDAIAPATRSRRHAAAARLLHERGADPAAVASHLSLCDPIGEAWVVAPLREAAQVAQGRGAVPTALAQLRRALAEPGFAQDPELLLELGIAERSLGEAVWEAHVESAAATLRDPERRRRALAALGYGRWVAGDPEGALEVVQGALAEIQPGRGGAPEAELLMSFFLAGRYAPSLTRAVQAQLAVERLGPEGRATPGEATRLALCGIDAALRGRAADAVALGRAALEWTQSDSSFVALTSPIVPASLAVPIVAALAFLFAGRPREAERALEPVLKLAQQTGNRLLLGAALEARILARFERGDVRGGLADAEMVLELSEAWEIAAIPSRCLCSELLLERAEPEAAIEALRLPDGVETRLSLGSPGFLYLPRSRARLALARGQWQEALGHALLCGERVEAVDAGSPDFQPWRSLAAQAAHALGQHERALALVIDELALARKIESPRATGVALITLGTIEGGGGIEALREAVELLDTTEAELQQVRARLALGMALRRQGKRREARALLADAAERARGLGAIATAETAEAELRIAGGRPRRLRPHGVEVLTPSQLRVAELAAAGHSNKEIAQSLFVTLRTVETHLTEVYRRLAIGSRDQLAAALQTEAARPVPDVVQALENRDQSGESRPPHPPEPTLPPPRRTH